MMVRAQPALRMLLCFLRVNWLHKSGILAAGNTVGRSLRSFPRSATRQAAQATEMSAARACIDIQGSSRCD